LIDAAITVIATRGESALRLIEVAEMAGIKQPTIHHFFPTREDLVLAAHRERYRRAVLDALGSYDDVVAGATTRGEFLKASRLGLKAALDDTRIAVRAARIALFAKAETNADLRRELNDAAYETNLKLARALENAQRQGWIRDDVSPLTLAVWVRSQVMGRIVLEMDLSRYDGDEWTRLALEAVDAVMTGGTSGGTSPSSGKSGTKRPARRR
jgi:AcrR family transcriptional regulator